MPLPPPVAEVRIPVELDRQRTMIFNVNSMVAYEEATGKFFLSTVSDLYAIIYPDGLKMNIDGQLEGRVERNTISILRKVSMKDLRALLWSVIHEYDKDGNPSWPLTIAEVGRFLTLSNIAPMFQRFLTGQSGNSPSKTEMGESPAVSTMNAESSLPKTSETGGAPGIELPEGVLD